MLIRRKNLPDDILGQEDCRRIGDRRTNRALARKRLVGWKTNTDRSCRRDDKHPLLREVLATKQSDFDYFFLDCTDLLIPVHYTASKVRARITTLRSRVQISVPRHADPKNDSFCDLAFNVHSEKV